ncbi:large ribosomal RNA subunit accumulation protein YCED homolog 2, chloroplastic-like [Arachis stenosperma]|uniref:large ribosomal RNA subunit accumulation protein YCED homolog 2, chloroplastic-like n=1 Tax=Arachis stenosperma TaxID=217475 RepID=UPI0025ABE567|nr:large ribosomal RNA subunit accumulation protein YCED homolog 2, chloroplastic-like [Arachis stenosperma]
MLNNWQERKQGDGRYHGDWTSNYDVSLQDLQLQDLIDDNEQHKDAQLFIKLNIQKDTCSELCQKSEGTILFSSGQSQAYVDKKWFSRLLELKEKKKKKKKTHDLYRMEIRSSLYIIIDNLQIDCMYK